MFWRRIPQGGRDSSGKQFITIFSSSVHFAYLIDMKLMSFNFEHLIAIDSSYPTSIVSWRSFSCWNNFSQQLPNHFSWHELFLSLKQDTFIIAQKILISCAWLKSDPFIKCSHSVRSIIASQCNIPFHFPNNRHLVSYNFIFTHMMKNLCREIHPAVEYCTM